MRAFIRALLILPMVSIIAIGAVLALYDALHWSWYVLALGWLAMVVVVELPTPPDYTPDD